MAQWLEWLLFLQRTQVCCVAPTSDSSQPFSVAPVAGDPTPSGLLQHLHHMVHKNSHRHIYIKIHKGGNKIDSEIYENTLVYLLWNVFLQAGVLVALLVVDTNSKQLKKKNSGIFWKRIQLN